jgi:hypothetical protein
MTNDTNYRKKGRAVFLAAIMVISMVGVGFAGFAGSAAAQEQTANEAVHFQSSGTINGASEGDGVIELSFDNNIDNSTGVITVETPGANLDRDINGSEVTVTDGQVVVNTGSIFPRVDQVSFTGVVDVNGNSVTGPTDVDFLGSTLDGVDDPSNVFEGTELAIVADSLGADVTIESDQARSPNRKPEPTVRLRALTQQIVRLRIMKSPAMLELTLHSVISI